MLRLKKRKGFILLTAVYASIICFLAAYGLVAVSSSQFATHSASRIAMYTQAFASAKAKEIELVDYSKASTVAEPRIAITSEYDREVLVGSEVDLGSGNKKRDITVNIYKTGESTPRESLIVPLTSQGNGNDGLIVGAVVAWPLATIPENYLECNGQYVDPAIYPKLAALMSYTPDYKGVFLRGYGSVISNHFGTVTHISGNLGELQGDTIRNIIGGMEGSNNTNGEKTYGAFRKDTFLQAFVHLGDTSWTDFANYAFDASRVVPTANENRPVNKSVIYIIKAK